MQKLYPSTLWHVIQSFWQHRSLIARMTKREVVGRYQGSFLGLLWSFFNPIVMLVVYTFFFSVIFKARWGNLAESSRAEFAVILFAGLIIYNFFSECINRAPNLILSNVNYVKKVVFPLEILPWTALGSALFHVFISTCVLLAFFLYLNHYIPWTVIYLPVIMLPFIFLVLGIMWFLAAISVFVRDVNQIIGMFTTVLLFLSPIFYPVTALPENYRHYLYVNPLTFIVEQTRAIMILGEQPHWQGWLFYLAIGLLIAWCGLSWFQKVRKAFADVL